MKKLALISIFIITFTNTVNAVSYNSDPKFFIQELVNDALATLNDKSISKEKKAKVVEKIAKENVDIKAIGFYTLGELRKTISPENLEKYNNLFEEYFLKNLTSRLGDYSANKFEVLEADQKNAKYTIVKSRVAGSSTQPEIKIDWRVYTKDPLKPLIRDLVVEGLSLAKTQKEEFASILSSNNNDINLLFSKLEEFISKY
ncbi:ABC transporter substrate-binding protein [Pelagibacteraceae bacterium]|nr:ABC transporter substrate-binding protein [Pelagibacteraceae bacterium]